MKLLFVILIIWLLAYNDGELFRVLHSYLMEQLR